MLCCTVTCTEQEGLETVRLQVQVSQSHHQVQPAVSAFFPSMTHKLADIAQRDVTSMEIAIMTAIWGPNRSCRAQELVFALLLPSHRVAPSMVVPYKQMCWLAHLARTQGTAQVVAQAIWDETELPKAIGPFSRALQEFRRLDWRPVPEWWQWSLHLTRGRQSILCTRTRSMWSTSSGSRSGGISSKRWKRGDRTPLAAWERG